MPVVSADTVQFAIAAETAGSPGVLPAPPAFNRLRITGESMNFNSQTAQSSEMDPSRGVRDQLIVGGASAGDLNYELHQSDEIEELLAAAFANDWGANAPDADDLILGGIMKTYTIERRLTLDDTPTYAFHRFDASVLSRMTMQIQPGQPISGAFSFSGKSVILDRAELVGATYSTPNTNPVFRPSDTQFIDLGGQTGAACGQSLTFTLDNNVRAVECIGELGAREQVLGKAVATLEGAFYFSEPIDDLYQMFLDGAEFTTRWQIQDTAVPQKNRYTFEYLRSKIASFTVAAGGSGEDVVAQLSIAALVPPATAAYASAVRVQRALV